MPAMIGLLALALLTASPAPASTPAPLTTVAERSGWTHTGRYDEVIQLCHAFVRRYLGKVRCEQFGTTPEHRPMLALVASADGTLDAKSARERHRPVVLFQGGIHAGEIDGKDAGFWLLRDLLDGKVLPGALGKLTAVFVPVFNIDGHERFGKNNRPNQVGPEEMGWRVTAQNLNLNRDYVKADAPEMVAMLRFLDAWDPVLLMDLHVTDGAQFQPDVAVLLDPNLSGPAPMRAVGHAAKVAIFDELTKEGHQPLDFYPSFIDEEDPASGFAQGVASPRFSSGYWPLRNRFAVLVETHSWKDYATRVKLTRDVVVAFLRQVAADGTRWMDVARQADAADRAGPENALPVTWTHTDRKITLDYPGYHYERKPSPISGALGITYDPSRPEIWHVPYYPDVTPKLSVDAPKAGYVVPAAEAGWVKEKLDLHGFHYTVLQKPMRLSVQAYRARPSQIHFDPDSFEGHQQLTTDGQWGTETQEVLPGSLFVPSAQRGQPLLAQLFAPNAPDSLIAWGGFNAFFERKEYIEPYVLEPWAEQQLARDPALKAEFEARLKDPAFAKSPRARLRFFAERHPSWDSRYGLYPVYRVDEVPGR